MLTHFQEREQRKILLEEDEDALLWEAIEKSDLSEIQFLMNQGHECPYCTHGCDDCLMTGY